MKARRIGTTTEFEVEGIIMNGIGYVMEEVEVLQTATELSTKPDWPQIKIQAAIAAMSALITGQFAEQTGKSISRSKTAAESVLFADSLITELKKQTR